MESKINLGCGKGQLLEGYLNVDKFFDCDLRIDLEKVPWSLPDNQFEEVLLLGVLEHLINPIEVMEEIFRISKSDAVIKISVPHFSGVFAHSPLHKTFFSVGSMNNFTSVSDEHYGNCEYKILSKKIFWQPHSSKWYRESTLVRRFLFNVGRVVNVFINFNQSLFERFWCFWVGGACDIEWVLKVKK